MPAGRTIVPLLLALATACTQPRPAARLASDDGASHAARGAASGAPPDTALDTALDAATDTAADAAPGLLVDAGPGAGRVLADFDAAVGRPRFLAILSPT
jgi:hypothetical protein